MKALECRVEGQPGWQAGGPSSPTLLTSPLSPRPAPDPMMWWQCGPGFLRSPPLVPRTPGARLPTPKMGSDLLSPCPGAVVSCLFHDTWSTRCVFCLKTFLIKLKFTYNEIHRCDHVKVHHTGVLRTFTVL